MNEREIIDRKYLCDLAKEVGLTTLDLSKFSYISKFHIIISCKSIVYIVMCFYQETN